MKLPATARRVSSGMDEDARLVRWSRWARLGMMRKEGIGGRGGIAVVR